jgi:hypothetical protein
MECNTKARQGESLKKKLESKVMHGQYIRSIHRQFISKENTFLWLLWGDLKAETESEIVAAQDQALQTKYHARKILQMETYSKCRLCQQSDETTDHVTSPCPIPTKDIKRHERVLNYTSKTNVIPVILGATGTIAK